MKARKRNIAAFFSFFALSLFSCEKAKDVALTVNTVCRIPTACKIASVSIGKSRSLYVVTVFCKGKEEVAYSDSLLTRPRIIKFKRENREDMVCKRAD